MHVTTVDHTAIRFTQAWVVTVTLLGFLTQWSAPVLLMGLILAASATWPERAPLRLFYARVLRPRGLLRPDLRPDDPAPHRFAQAVGATVLLASFLVLRTGGANVGWALDLLVAILAALNLFVGFCAGCFLFYQLRRLHLIPTPAGRA